MRSSRSRRIGTISLFGRRLTKTTKRKPNRSSYARFSSVELGRLVASPCSAARAGRERRRADRRVRVEHLLLLLVGQARGDLARVAERVVELGEPLDEARAALEELRELLDGQLPR